MADENDDKSPDGGLGSTLYVILGIPCMILFFVVVFGLVGACDTMGVMIPA